MRSPPGGSSGTVVSGAQRVACGGPAVTVLQARWAAAARIIITDERKVAAWRRSPPC